MSSTDQDPVVLFEAAQNAAADLARESVPGLQSVLGGMMLSEQGRPEVEAYLTAVVLKGVALGQTTALELFGILIDKEI